MAYWGWGTIPDQYGRHRAEDDGEGCAPSRPRQPHVMLDHGSPFMTDEAMVGADAALDVDAERGIRATR